MKSKLINKAMYQRNVPGCRVTDKLAHMKGQNIPKYLAHNSLTLNH